MKKIAIVIPEVAGPGGAEKVAVDLMHEFNRRQYEVMVIRFDALHAGDVPYSIVGQDVHLDIPNREGGLLVQLQIMLQRAWQFYRIFRRERFDHIFSFLEAANIPCALASSHSVLSVHLDPNTMTHKIWLAMTWLYPRAKRVVAVSKQMQLRLEQRAHLQNVTCIYNPVDFEHVRQQAREAIAITQPFILAVGRLEQQKRFDRLLQAFAMTRTREQCQLVIVGSGSQAAPLKQLALSLGIDEHVVFIGYEANPYKYMARAVFQVMSSDYEGYPLVLIEALALGCPVISTDCPTGPREIIQHNVNGVLVEPADVQALAQGIDALYFDPDKCSEFKRNAPLSVAQNDIKAIADAWLAA